LNRSILYRSFDIASQAFFHDDKEKGGKRVPLTDASGRRERLGGYSINQNRKEGRGSDFQNPNDPIPAKAKSCEKEVHVIPTEAIKIF
jgi:hypothetical protein